jgi:hypothetical protein
MLQRKAKKDPGMVAVGVFTLLIYGVGTIAGSIAEVLQHMPNRFDIGFWLWTGWGIFASIVAIVAIRRYK